jgi:cytochrome c-type biogenesis protein CcmH
VAVAKLKVSDIRGPVLLDDRLAMQPQFKLSNYDAITITARISFSENATPTVGDIQGQSERVNRPFPAQPIAIVLNEVVE